ncbi:MAG: FKBP-type peptidyl-prolyl cis-trans isomerase [Janthinobacterium lividum]
MKRSLLAFFSVAALGGALRTQAQQAPAAGFERLPSGTEYQLFRRAAGGGYQRRPLVVPADSAFSTRQGKFLMAHVAYLTGRDSVLQSSRQQLKNQPVPVPLQPVQRKGGPEEAMALLLPGDSAVFRFRADSLFKGRPVPAELKRGGNVLVLHVTAVGLVTQAQAMAAMQQIQQQAQVEQERQAKAHAATQLPKDNAAIQAYLQQNKLAATAKKTPGGTWYIITKRGTGPLPTTGETVSVKYRGTVLATGKEFDSSDKHGGKPFDFKLGAGQVIPGWDQGIAALPKGSTATLLIPSSLAYGERGAGADIPADAPLRFDVELMSVKPAAHSTASKGKPAVKSKASSATKKK